VSVAEELDMRPERIARAHARLAPRPFD
jgi:hypothetical protein